jgi:hypothetical protein
VYTVVRVDDAAAQTGTLQCVVTFSLSRGQIATQALVKITNGQLTGAQTAPITGGTGRYRNADGETVVEFISNDAANITFDLDS